MEATPVGLQPSPIPDGEEPRASVTCGQTFSRGNNTFLSDPADQEETRPKPTTIYTDFSHRLPAGSRQARDSRESIKPRIKAQDSLDSVAFHDGQMHGITRRHLSMPHDNFLCALCCGQINGQHLVGTTEQTVERSLDGLPPTDSDVE